MQVLGWAGDTWSLEPGPALLRPRYGHCGATLAGQVVVVGGRGEEGVVDTVEVGTLYYTLLWSVRAVAGAGHGDQDREDRAGLDHAQQEVALPHYLHTIYTLSTH